VEAPPSVSTPQPPEVGASLTVSTSQQLPSGSLIDSGLREALSG